MTGRPADLNLTGHALTPGAQRSWWLREALAHESGPDCPALASDITADLVIVGGGFTGLWTAYFLTEIKPDLGIVVLEQDVCGGGPSGRNGGFASGWWDELDGLVALYGADAAAKSCRAISESINSIGQFCWTNGIGAWFKKSGYMYAITADAHEKLCEEMVALAREVGAPDELRELTAAEVRARCESPAFRGGAYMRDGASVLALNAWATGWPQLQRRLVAWSSYIVLTAPAPEKLAAIGWTGGEVISDFRTSLRYFRTTRDGRIAFGGGGGRARPAIDDAFTHDARAVTEAAQGFRLMFPSFADVPLEDAWGGPIDVSPTHLPVFGTLEPGNLFYALGYTGNGVAPTHLAGQVLADLVLGRDTDTVRLPIVNPPPRLFPPQPFRSWGAAVVRRAMIAKETAEEQGRRPNRLINQIARMPRRMGYLLGH